jgi:glycosyltransferase involved in cell wall biosynthesis
MEIFFPRLFHHTCVHTQEIADEVKRLAGLGSARVLRLDQGVDTSLFTHRQKEIYPTRPVVLYAAHLGVAAEGLQFVLEGFRNLAPKNKDAILLVVGSGPLLHQFRKTAQKLKLDERVVFAGNISHHLMPRVMELARVAVNYTSPENPANHCRASVKVREYLAMGLPVATNLVGSDLIPFRPFLQLFDAGDLEGFALAVRRGLEERGSDAASREIANNWAWEVVVKRFLQELQQW